MPERVTKPLREVLTALLTEPTREWYGLELIEATGLRSGTLYPLLHRLVEDGWLVRTREEPSDLGGTGRRLYRLTGAGLRAAVELAEPAVTKRRRPRAAQLRPEVRPA